MLASCAVLAGVGVYGILARRNAVGGRITHFSKHPVRYKMWTFVSRINAHHMKWAWISLCTVVLADFYVYALASGLLGSDPHISF